MKVKIDLHIHSVLSPCADIENTLGNIINMSMLNEVDFIAIADHNSAKNCEVAIELGKRVGITVVPAIEVTTSEEIHMLCLFKKVENAIALSNYLAENISKYPLNKKLYLPQRVLDINDNTIEYVDYLLSVATKIDIYQLNEKVAQLSGVVIPAHIDKDSNSMLSILAEMPSDLIYNTIEVSKNINESKLLELKRKYNVILNSDAHCLDDLCIKFTEIDLKEKSIDCLFAFLKNDIIGKK